MKVKRIINIFISSPLLIFSFEECVTLLSNKVKLKLSMTRAVVVAQLAERSLMTPEIRSSNPDIGNKIFQMQLIICQLQSRKDKNKGKEAGNGPFKKLSMNIHFIE